MLVTTLVAGGAATTLPALLGVGVGTSSIIGAIALQESQKKAAKVASRVAIAIGTSLGSTVIQGNYQKKLQNEMEGRVKSAMEKNGGELTKKQMSDLTDEVYRRKGMVSMATAGVSAFVSVALGSVAGNIIDASDLM